MKAELSERKIWSEWMGAAQKGDKESYHALLTAIQPLLRSYYRSRVQSPSAGDDLVQTALLRVHLYRESFDPKQAFDVWMYSIARNVFRDFLSQNKSHSTLQNIDDVDVSTESESEGKIQLEHALTQLTPEQSEVIRLVKILGLSMEEAAKTLNISTSAVKVRAHRAYEALKSNLMQSFL